MKSIIEMLKDEFNGRPLTVEEVLNLKKMDQLDEYFENSLDKTQKENYYALEETRTEIIGLEVKRALQIGFMFGLQVCEFLDKKDFNIDK